MELITTTTVCATDILVSSGLHYDYSEVENLGLTKGLMRLTRVNFRLSGHIYRGQNILCGMGVWTLSRTRFSLSAQTATQL